MLFLALVFVGLVSVHHLRPMVETAVLVRAGLVVQGVPTGIRVESITLPVAAFRIGSFTAELLELLADVQLFESK